MQPNNKLCNIVVKDCTNHSHSISEIYIVRLYQAANFSNAPCNINATVMSVVLSSWPKPLREFSWFIWWLQTERWVAANPTNPTSLTTVSPPINVKWSGFALRYQTVLSGVDQDGMSSLGDIPSLGSVLWHGWLGDVRPVKTWNTCFRRFCSRTVGGRNSRRSPAHAGRCMWEVKTKMMVIVVVRAVWSMRTSDMVLVWSCSDVSERDSASCVPSKDERRHLTPPTQPFYCPFSRTTRVSRRQKRTSGLYGAREN